MHIEEPGYGYHGNCVCDLCLRLFKSIYGFDETQDIEGEQAVDLKCLGMTAFMRELERMLQNRNPKLILSTTGGYLWSDDRTLGRDWARWAQYGWLGFYAPEIYTTDLQDFRRRLQTTISDVGRDCPVCVGVLVENDGPRNSVQQVIGQIDTARQVGARGVILFHGKKITDDYLNALKTGPFSKPATLPEFK